MLFIVILMAAAVAFFAFGFIVGSSIKKRNYENAQREAMRQRKYFERMETRR